MSFKKLVLNFLMKEKNYSARTVYFLCFLFLLSMIKIKSHLEALGMTTEMIIMLFRQPLSTLAAITHLVIICHINLRGYS